MKKRGKAVLVVLAALSLAAASLEVPTARSAGDLPVYLQDRGTGVATSMFGRYLNKGDLMVYPFFEYYKNSDEEYAPNELGIEGDDTDYRGDYKASEWLIYFGYGITEDLMVELEAAYIDATLKTSTEDPNQGTPGYDEISESGLGDVEGQIRWRFLRENESRPEMFTYFETVAPTQKDSNYIIGTPDWEFKLGVGVVKGFGWGTVTGRGSVAYVAEESKFEVGEFALEYLKKLSPSWTVYAGIEGSEDEVEFIPELLWTFSKGHPEMTLVLNSAFGLTSKAADWAPEVGIQFLF